MTIHHSVCIIHVYIAQRVMHFSAFILLLFLEKRKWNENVIYTWTGYN